MNKFKFGQKVRIVSKLVRRAKQIEIYSRIGMGIESIQEQRIWVKVPEMRFGLYIGQRTLCNGDIDFDREGCAFFNTKERFKVALVVCSQHENPIYQFFAYYN